jgi:hypothetical protein
MDIRYQLAPKDVDALTAFTQRGTLAGWIHRRMPWVLAVAIVCVLANLYSAKQLSIANGMPAVFVGFLTFFWIRRHHYMRQRVPTLFEPMTLNVGAEGLRATSPGQSGTTEWSRVQGYGVTDAHVFIMTDRARGYVVPKRHLEGEDAAALVQLLEQHARPVPKSAAPRPKILRFFLVWLGVTILILLAMHYSGAHK